MNASITITQITDTQQLDISQFNTLLDDDKTWDEDQAHLFLSNADTALFVAFSGKKEVGFVTAYRLQRFDNLRVEVLLYEIGVDESYRRRGIGAALVDAVKHWAAEKGASEMWVLTERSNLSAKQFYTATGGREGGEESSMFTYIIETDMQSNTFLLREK